MATHSFSAVLERSSTDSTWFVVIVPPEVAQALAAGRLARASGIIAGQPFRCGLRSYSDGRHYLVVNKAVRQAAGVTEGDTLEVTLEIDAEESEAPLPADLAAVLNGNPAAGAAFTRMAPSHRREFVSWLEETQNPDTRQKRLSRTVEMLAARIGPRTSTNRSSRGG